METLETKKVAKSCKNFNCEICNYITKRKSSYDKHLLTSKHKNKQMETNSCEYLEKVAKNNYTCNNCNKIFKNRSGLWKHNKKCITTNDIITKNIDNHINDNINDNINDKDLIMVLLKENKEIKDMMFEIMKNGITNNYITNNNNNHSNSHNKTFNLQVFLNETCKDAMNINDFVNSIQLQLDDFERMGEVGYAQGISDIITNHLNALDVTQRPVHCTDKKRETIYVKEDNQWIKEDENKTKIKKMIKRIENKNIQIIPQFQKKYPNHANPKSHESDKYHKTIIEVMGGMGGSEGKQDKIIRNITKHTTIHK